jgi:hypothetical protein
MSEKHEQPLSTAEKRFGSFMYRLAAAGLFAFGGKIAFETGADHGFNASGNSGLVGALFMATVGVGAWYMAREVSLPDEQSENNQGT